MQTVKESEMKSLGFPEWMIDRIKNYCVGRKCEYWQNQCNAPTMMCHIEIDKTKPLGEFVFHFSIQYWLAMQEIKYGIK